MMRTPPPRPLGEAVSQPDLFRSPEMADLDLNTRKRKCPNNEVGDYPNDACDEIAQASIQSMFSNVQQMFLELQSSQQEIFTHIKKDIYALKNQNEELLASNKEIKQSMINIIEEQNALIARVEQLEKKDGTSASYALALEQQVENMERKLRETSIEINNLPTDSNEQMLDAVEQLHKVLHVEYDQRDQRCVYRLPAKPNQPRPIILEYTTLHKKIEVLQAYKKYNTKNKGERLNSSFTGLNGTPKVVYIKELLTKKGKHLHYLARELVKNTLWRFCWTVGGKVFIRKEEGQPAVEVKSDDQIASLHEEANRQK